MRRRPPASPSAKYRALLDTAEAQFGALGFKKANVDVIAERAGISKPLVYRYFGDKRGLFELVVDRVLKEWSAVLVAEAARATPGISQRVFSIAAG